MFLLRLIYYLKWSKSLKYNWGEKQFASDMLRYGQVFGEIDFFRLDAEIKKRNDVLGLHSNCTDKNNTVLLLILILLILGGVSSIMTYFTFYFLSIYL
jgi:hypothetical protein